MEKDYFNMLRDISKGLMGIHTKSVIHRDIKPENIIFKDGVYKITDFGISTVKDADYQVAGTPLYWGP